MRLLLTALLLAPLAQPPEYTLAVCWHITLLGNSTAIVDIRYHPFLLDGVDAWDLRHNYLFYHELQRKTLEAVSAAFRVDPYYIKVLSEVHESKLGVWFDADSDGKLEYYDNSVRVVIAVRLDASPYFKQTEAGYLISMRDPYTSAWPESWIDLLEVMVEPPLKIAEVKWAPDQAKPARQEVSSVRWESPTTELAPDLITVSAAVMPSQTRALTHVSTGIQPTPGYTSALTLEPQRKLRCIGCITAVFLCCIAVAALAVRRRAGG